MRNTAAKESTVKETPEVWGRCRYIGYEEGARAYCVGLSTFIKLAHDAKAIRKYGKVVFVDCEKVDKYIGKLPQS